jgi:hypothetical protein
MAHTVSGPRETARVTTPEAETRPKRRYGTIVRHLSDDPETAAELVAKLPDGVLIHLGAAIADEMGRRAVASGDEDAVIDDAFETGFGRDGMGVMPWVSGHYVVCPGSLIAKSRSSHRCRFVSVDDTWVWESDLLINEVKRSIPGTADGFRAVALLPIIEGTQVDVVAGRQRQGQHTVEHVVSFVVRKGKLVEVSQRTVKPTGMM